MSPLKCPQCGGEGRFAKMIDGSHKCGFCGSVVDLKETRLKQKAEGAQIMYPSGENEPVFGSLETGSDNNLPPIDDMPMPDTPPWQGEGGEFSGGGASGDFSNDAPSDVSSGGVDSTGDF